MKRVAACLTLGGVLTLLSGCSSLGDFGLESKKIDYKTAGSARVPTLEVPPDLTSPARDDRYAVPDVGGKGTATFSTYAGERSPQAKAQQTDVLPQVAKARIERAGSQRWLVVESAPDQLWGQVKDFWQELGFLINLEVPEAGVMETDWAENRAKIPEGGLRMVLGKVLDSLYSTSERDKFRTRLEPGSVPGTTEVYISHRGMYEIYITEKSDQTRWQPREPDPELEAEMLRRLMVRFGSDQKRAAEDLAALRNKPADRAKLASSGGGSSLEVLETFDRAWRRVGLALDRVGFTVEDRDRSKGLYFVRYVDPEADEGKKSNDGFLAKLAFWKGSAPPPQSKYRVYVKDSGAVTSVQVLSAEGGAEQTDSSKKILALLYEQLR